MGLGKLNSTNFNWLHHPAGLFLIKNVPFFCNHVTTSWLYKARRADSIIDCSVNFNVKNPEGVIWFQLT
ncbi:MAG: hypothetical protein EAY75_13630 [Bacteroidetes bacterium]|nr:MAG: hypothetical protein EAY75_13630 [Bacteroidota bacterium]